MAEGNENDLLNPVGKGYVGDLEVWFVAGF